MSGISLKGIGVFLLLVLVVLCSTFDVCDGRRGKHWRHKKAPYSSLAKKKGKGKISGSYHRGRGGRGQWSPKPSPNNSPGKRYPRPAAPKAAMFDVLDFGAKGDGVTDDTKAFEAAWAAACKVEASTMVVPAEFRFLVRPISFSGPYCQPNIVFQLDGTIIAPTSSKAWGSGLLQWLEFTKLKGITISGSGIIEGRGSVWWTNSESDVDPIHAKLSAKMPEIKPTALRFYGSYNVTVTGITIQNSPQCHLKFDFCDAVQVFNITISSPGSSLNTDGIHLQNSKDVSIHHTDLGCGDDCISIQTGCSNINIHNVNCGPGHGISIGGLGRDNTKACVSNITVRDVNMHNTMNGVRVKTWQGGSGSVQSIRFSNIKVSEVQTPIVIDQFYCDRRSCKNQTSAVALSSIAYENIKGTFTVQPVRLACSDSLPCSGISLTEVELKPLQEHYHMYEPFCWQAYGELYTPTVPPIVCLQTGKPTSNRIQSDHDSC
ncbi:polygalacturonase At1g48100 [Elaeis guineensis]|uniref:polygalacturonase At1g48100 n=1 Tax=Elaeis guineensis var. tenera TaxID=51953 RepID=UPI003C6D27D7